MYLHLCEVAYVEEPSSVLLIPLDVVLFNADTLMQTC